MLLVEHTMVIIYSSSIVYRAQELATSNRLEMRPLWPRVDSSDHERTKTLSQVQEPILEQAAEADQ